MPARGLLAALLLALLLIAAPATASAQGGGTSPGQTPPEDETGQTPAQSPFDGNAMEVIAAQLLRTPTPPASVNPDVPVDLSAVVMRCMAKKPAERFATIAELDAALAACCCAAAWGGEQAAAWWAGRGPDEPAP